MPKAKEKYPYQGRVLRYLYANRLILRRIVNIMMRTSMLAVFFFLIGMYQRFTPSTQYRLLDITRYTATFSFVATLFMIILRVVVSRYRKIRLHHILGETLYMFVMLFLAIINSVLGVWLDGNVLPI
ncbi:hypothetical protein [Entomospira culicis]|uniref:Uncharacterized protein n=2 Tax=Entomospira culicis TaxID=2719989 RepID=A0A968GDS0_9SPIO|nr:hypothetical protein [Entomospira culicis]NIZ18478.1 hypothetical protein [Entomospira culicis]NIZ68694.1 hypothetical protein [Entomospira culicis]WDI37293.1 hypothetical protein PVA46_00445 [Entomospira culicis]WDI38922.1 hypothetical protein PVA47_00455 [Entomospira culicis]